MKNIFLIVALISSGILCSQSKSFSISGTLISNDSIPLESATVYLQTARDSTLITYTITDRKGAFLIENKTTDKSVDLFVSYIGYENFYKNIVLNKNSINLGTVKMEEEDNTLEEVIVKSVAPPIRFKKDTIEFNVKSFKTKKDANVEDLLKELPGFEVDENGGITINGKPMNKILVNGKPFFGSDPTIATKNLSKDIIQKIQVLDTKTDAQAFTGEDGDGTNKTINLVIRKEDNRGVFGRVAAGYGTDNRYEAAGMFNSFNNGQQVSVLAGGNNINSPGFSYGEINKMFGGNSSYNIDSQVFGYGNRGLITSENGGANFADDIGDKVRLSANYFYSNTDAENENISKVENTFPENRYYSNSISNTFSNTIKHSTETELHIKLDSTMLIDIYPNFRLDKGTRSENSKNESLDEELNLVNESTSNSIKETDNKTFSNNFIFTKRYGSNSGYFRVELYTNIAESDSENIFNSELKIYGDEPETKQENVIINEEGSINTFSSNLIYRIPLKQQELSVDLKYGYRSNKDKSLIDAVDIDESTGVRASNELLNSDFEYLNTAKKPGLSLNYRKEKWRSSFEGTMVYRRLENKDYLRPEYNLKRDFNAMDLRYRLRYRSPKNSFRFNYNLNNNPARLSQMQTVVDITNPLNIVVGNPNLKQAKDHKISLNYSYNNFQSGKGVYAYVSGNIVNDKVVSRSVINEDLTKLTTYSNVDGSYNVYGSVSFNKKVELDSVKSLNLNIGLRNSVRRTINYYNDVQFSSLSNTITPTIGARFRWTDVTELNMYYRLNLNENTFTSDAFENRKFTSHNVTLRTTNNFYEKIELRNQISYVYNTNISEGFDKNSVFWNATLGYSLLKETATVTLKAYDLLNQNTDARRVISGNTIADRQNTVLKRYFMLSFSWKFNTLGKKGESNDRGRRYRVY